MKIYFQVKRFFSLGFLNFLITNLILQIGLIILPVWIATLISQLTNLLLGFFLYGRFVFKENILNYVFAFKYLLISILSWIINMNCINLLVSLFGMSGSLAAILTIPLLTIYSFAAQKFFVFKNKKDIKYR